MRKSDIKNKTKADLERFVQEKREALRMIRFGVAGGRVKNVKEAKTTRKDIARALTFLKTPADRQAGK